LPDVTTYQEDDVFMVTKHFKRIFQRWPHLQKNVLEVRDLECLMLALGVTNKPVLSGEYLNAFEGFADLNERRVRDAEVVGAACGTKNVNIALEIGTSLGHMTALMSKNAQNAALYTVNIPPEEVQRGGKRITWAPTREQIGQYYREQGCNNVKQIFANTANWKPDFGPIDVAFIDGCHDADFVFNDTKKVLERSRPGTIVMWHDFSLDHARSFGWIGQVLDGVEKLYRKRLIKGRILHMRDSWVGLYRVPT
jgi:predicted O-methyltransferase YrrM